MNVRDEVKIVNCKVQGIESQFFIHTSFPERNASLTVGHSKANKINYLTVLHMIAFAS